MLPRFFNVSSALSLKAKASSPVSIGIPLIANAIILNFKRSTLPQKYAFFLKPPRKSQEICKLSAIYYKTSSSIIQSTFSKAVPARTTWRDLWLIRQPYSEAVPSTGGRFSPSSLRFLSPTNGGTEGVVKTIEERFVHSHPPHEASLLQYRQDHCTHSLSYPASYLYHLDSRRRIGIEQLRSSTENHNCCCSHDVGFGTIQSSLFPIYFQNTISFSGVSVNAMLFVTTK